jgi:ElaB/YqjD/DUF883 family membrane-anchored ribosome-binding protein
MSTETSSYTGNAQAQPYGSSSTGNPGGQTASSRVDTLKDNVGNAFDRGRSDIAASASMAGDNLSADVARLREDIAAIQQTMSKFASEAGGQAVKTAQDVGSAVASQVGDVASEMASAAKDQAKTLVSEVESMARRNPLGTVGATLLVGVIIGMMSRGGRG